MKFRPCIDLHSGKVKQIVGSTLTDAASASVDATAAASSSSPPPPSENFSTDRPASDYAEMYRRDGLTGGHVIMLGPGNDGAATDAVRAFPNGLQVGGGISPSNAARWIEEGASHVIVTSYVFRDGRIDYGRLDELVEAVGGKERLVLDLSCRRKPKKKEDTREVEEGGGGDGEEGAADDDDEDPYYVVTDRWQKYTDVVVNRETLTDLSRYCDEFLVHGVENEGKRCGILDDLVVLLAHASPIPVTYAGGVRDMDDVERVKALGMGKVDLTIGSALDCFGGDLSYDDVVAWHMRENPVCD